MTADRTFNLRDRASHSFGFTLIEMVLVLAILAILAAVAVRSLDGVEDQSRSDASRKQMQDIEEAILGSPNERDADGSLIVRGFVADVGRLPIAIGNDPAAQLQELWSNPRNLQLIGLRSAPLPDSDVQLATGWRGGYLRLGVGQTRIQDLWADNGNPTLYDLLRADGTSAQDGDSIVMIRSRGSDNQLGSATGAAFEADQTVVFNSTDSTIPSRFIGSLGGQISIADSSGTIQEIDPANGDEIVVKFFGPDPNTGSLATQNITIPITGKVPSVSYSFPASNAITIGSRVVRAAQLHSSDLSTYTYRSIPVRLMIRPGAQTKDLVLQPVTP